MCIRTEPYSTSPPQPYFPQPSRPLGNHPGLELKLPSPISHGEACIRSNAIGLQGCYFLRRLANNLGGPQRSYALNAIDRAIKLWKGKRVRRPVPLRAPWLLAPNWRQRLKKILTSHVALMQPHNISLQPPSTNIVFTKCPSVMDSLCNHKEMATRWQTLKHQLQQVNRFLIFPSSASPPNLRWIVKIEGPKAGSCEFL